MNDVKILDCTLRDGGYYNSWDFAPELVRTYLAAMSAAGVDIVELGQRFARNSGFKGPHAFTTDEFLRTLDVPDNLQVAVMVNGADLLGDEGMEALLTRLFPETAQSSPVSLVRIACHLHEIVGIMPAVRWLKDRGFSVGVNLMQIAERSQEEVLAVARAAAEHPVDVLYFADSMGSMTPESTARIIDWLRDGWSGPIGIHTHDNMGIALQNTLCAAKAGVTWLDATVTGMGRGPGNARTEELVIALADERAGQVNLVPLMGLIREHLQPMKDKFRWGSNPYYFLSGKYGIHPTYIQEMAGDPRYSDEDILAVIDYLRTDQGKKYSLSSLAQARNFHQDVAAGTWAPETVMAGREVLIIGAGPGSYRHREAVESYIRRAKPLVLALNTQRTIDESLIDLRVASHPVRLLADAHEHMRLPQPLVVPATSLTERLAAELAGKQVFDFGLGVEEGRFAFDQTSCMTPNSLVISYALALAASGQASRVLLVGFDGYEAGDNRNAEMDATLDLYVGTPHSAPVLAVTPTIYGAVPVQSIYGM